MIPTIAFFLLATMAHAHMALWHPSGYGFNKGDEAVTPLSNKPFSQWWFHGYVDESPSEVMTLNPGQDVTLEIACSKEWTSWGGQSSQDACPNDAGSYHAGGSTGSESGWSGNDESNLIGCALAIAFKSDPHDVKPEDFTVMSIQERCVRQRDTSFSIPSNLPACPEGGCTCSWFWGGQNSANEMYMSAFKCDVQGGASTGYPTPSEPRKGQVSGPVQPFYWANDMNNLGYSVDYDSKPKYNSAWGWTNGAQEGAFGQGGSLPSTTASSSNRGGSQASSTSSPTPTSTWNDGDDEPTSTATYSTKSSWDDGDSESTSTKSSWDDGDSESTSTSSRRRHRPHSTSDDWNENQTATWNGLAAQPTATKKDCKRGLRSRKHMK